MSVDELTNLRAIVEAQRAANNRLASERATLSEALRAANRLRDQLDARVKRAYHAYHLISAEIGRCSRIEIDGKCWGCSQLDELEGKR